MIVHSRLRLILVVTTALLTVGGLFLAFHILNPTPPSTVRFATGPDGGAYAEFGERYRQIFADNGIDLQLVESAGSLENLQLLTDLEDGVDAAFVSMGAGQDSVRDGLESLGGVFFEPMWLFHRDLDFSLGFAGAVYGKRISIGPQGSASNASARAFYRLNDVDIADTDILEISPGEAAAALLEGDIDALFISSAVRNELIQSLLSNNGIRLQGFLRADTYVALFPALTKLRIPAGLGRLAENLPPEDVDLIAFTAIIAVREDLHDAIQSLLLEAASQVHGKPDAFHSYGNFPAPVSYDLPLSSVAIRYHESGRPFLQRYLPFWLAVLVMQIFVAAIPILGVLYPAVRFMPSVFDWAMRRRIFRLYSELRGLEARVSSAAADESQQELVDSLDKLDRKVRRLRVPTAFAHLAYNLRAHINVVRNRITD